MTEQLEIYWWFYWLCGRKPLTEHRNGQKGEYEKGVRIILFKENDFEMMSLLKLKTWKVIRKPQERYDCTKA